MNDTKYKEFAAGRAGTGSVNLATGALTFIHEDTKADANILPINISHVYSSNRGSDTTYDITYGKGFKLNLQQTLKKNQSDDVNDTKYIYTDAEGTEHTFEDRYFYIDNGGKRVYIPKISDITIDAEGKLTYIAGNVAYEVFLQQITESGLTLQSEFKTFKGSEKLETRHEDVVQLTEEISQLEKSIADLEYNVKQYKKNDSEDYKAILALQKTIEQSSIALEKTSIALEKTPMQKEWDEKYKDKPDNDNDKVAKEYLRNKLDLNDKMGSLNKKQETLRGDKNNYEEAEKKELKTRYDYLLGIAETDIKKYTNLKENKKEILKKLKIQIPVNFIIDKDNITWGFNADGNLVAVFDNYDNQVAIVYENGVIAKVVDADNREIIFEYQYKSTKTGQLVSVTDYKGHKTSFIYSGNDLKKIEYPNGEISQFSYMSEGLLNEILSPAKMGAQLLYNADKKVVSIAELTAAEKIDKNGISDGEKVAEKIADFAYEGRITVFSDIKNGVTKSNLFDSEGNLCRVQTTENDKLIAYTAYDESSMSQTGNRCNFAITADDISVNNISDIDILNIGDDSPVAFAEKIGAKKDWAADLTKLDPNNADYFLCGSATVAAAEKTPKRKKTNYCKLDMDSTNKRLEYKVLVDYQEEPTVTPPSEYTPIKSGDKINMLYLNTSFLNLPQSDATGFFGDRIKYPQIYLYYFYPIFGEGEFNINSRSHQVYYTAEDYSGDLLVNFGCALWAGKTLLWCNQLYKNHNSNVSKTGWQCDKIDLSSWGPITVHQNGKMFNWAQFLSKDDKFLRINDNNNYYIDEFIAGFDYQTKERQHVAIPITLRKANGKPKMPSKISVFAYFLQNKGEAVFEKPMLIKGKAAYSLLDELGNTVEESVSDPEKIAINDQTGSYSTVNSIVATDYNDDSLPTEKRTVYTYTTESGTSKQTAVEKWFYNPQGSVIEHWSYVEGEELTSGVNITETVYDKRGNAVKSFTYNSLDASTKFYSEQEIAENGRVLADIDDTGVNKTYYEYDDVTGEVKTATAPNGGKFSYAHDTNTDEITAITKSTDEGEANTTNRIYTAGFLTELKSGGNTVEFDYDSKGRKSAVTLNYAPYVAYEYKERADAVTNDVVTATVAPDTELSYTVLTERNKDGNLVKVKEGRNSSSLNESIVNVYFGKEDKDREGLLKTGEDKIAGTKTECTYNSLKQPLSVTVRDSGTNELLSSETSEYDEYGQIAKRKIVSGSYSYEYGYRYKSNFARELESVSMPYGLNSSRITDVYGRMKERVLTQSGIPLASEYYYFRKHGDHGTNQISSVRYGERKDGQFAVKDGVSYAYDECGNIAEVKENGKLSVRYGYDKLNRLIREDNARLGTTTLFAYDNNGNVLSKREAAFSLKGTDKFTEFTNEKEYAYDAENPDRLIAFGNNGILGYDSIGNPSQYRGKTLVWKKGRQLAGISDIVKTLSFTYDAMGRRTEKKADGENTKYFYAGNMLIREERSDKNSILYLGDDVIAGDGAVIDGVNKSVLEYIYGQDGIAGLVYDGAKYYFRRNVQGDITRIYSIDGTLHACYTYDAWGNHKVYDANGNENTNPYFIGNVNPFRYRGYYYDVETGLYYCISRYYDPETGRWINADSIEYLDPETINGLNLYAYCGNNPVMRIDPTGRSWKSFWSGVGNWFKDHWKELVIGAAFIVVGAVVTALTAGTGIGFMAAFGSALLSSVTQVGISMAVSVAIGGLVSVATGGGFFDNFGDSLASGFMWGGIFAGGAQILSGGFKAYASVADKFGKLQAVKSSPLFSPDRLKNATEIAKIAGKGQKFYDYGGTILRITKNLHLDVSTKSFLHLAAFGFKHIPVGAFGAGFIGGFFG